MADTNNISDQKTKTGSLYYALAILILAVIVMAIIGFFLLKKPAEIIEGQAEATTVRVSGKLPGRVIEFYVSEGDKDRKSVV